MNPTSLRHVAAAVLWATAASLPAHAASASLPPEQHSGAVAYVSGGIGDGQARRFESAFKDYPLVIELFEHGAQRDVYTADADVKITDAKGGLVLDQTSGGPFMLVRLPPGDYRVAASLKGHPLPQRRVHVVAGGREKATFVFPAELG
jgi:hypothetical protein